MSLFQTPAGGVEQNISRLRYGVPASTKPSPAPGTRAALKAKQQSILVSLEALDTPNPSMLQELVDVTRILENDTPIEQLRRRNAI